MSIAIRNACYLMVHRIKAFDCVDFFWSGKKLTIFKGCAKLCVAAL